MILVTTAGKVGSRTAQLLAESGRDVRLLVRDPARHHDLEASGVELFHGDLDDPASIARAVSGVESIVLVTAPVPAQERGVIDAVRHGGVVHITKITADSSPDSPIARRRDHYRIEQALAASGLPHTLLCANAYMQNLLALGPSIAATSAFSSSTGQGRIGMVDARDVAAAAAAIAVAPAGHSGASYRLSGPASVSYDDVAVQLSTLLGRTIRHDRITTREQEHAMIRMGLPEPVARANAQALELFAAGDSDWISDDIERILHRRATPFARFAEDCFPRGAA